MPEREQKFNESGKRGKTGKEVSIPRPLFEGGWVQATPQALQVLSEAKLEPMDLLARHLVGDWGCVGDEEKLLNDLAVKHGRRITSAYLLPTGNEIWVTTAGDREATWLKLPEQADPER